MRKKVWVAALAGAALAAVATGAFYLGVESSTDRSTPPPLPPPPTAAAGSPHGAEGVPRLPPPANAPAPGPPAAGGKYAHYRVGNSNVKALLADGDTMWIGSSGGVIRYDTVRDQHRLYDVRSGLLSNGVFHLSKIGANLVVGTYGGGMSLFNPQAETWENYNIQHGLADAFVYDVHQAANGDIWVATWSGANRVRGGRLENRDQWETFTVENTGGGLPNDWVYGVRGGANGDIWLATEGGLALYRQGQWHHWNHADGLGAPYPVVRDQIQFKRDPGKESSHHARQKAEQGLSDVDVAYNPNYVVSLEIDEHGVVWAGTWGGGLARFDGKTWRNFTMADGLPSNHIFMLHRDQGGRFWIGTGRGLVLMTGGRFKVFSTKDGLFAENVFSLALGEKDNLWVGGYGGVARFTGMPGEK